MNKIVKILEITFLFSNENKTLENTVTKLTENNQKLTAKTSACIKKDEIIEHSTDIEDKLVQIRENLTNYEQKCTERIIDRFAHMEEEVKRLHEKLDKIDSQTQSLVDFEMINQTDDLSCPEYNYTHLEDRLLRITHQLKRQKSSQVVHENRIKETTQMIIDNKIQEIDLRPIYNRHPDYLSEACGAKVVESRKE